MKKQRSRGALVGFVLASALLLRWVEWYIVGPASPFHLSSASTTAACDSSRTNNPRPRNLRIVLIGDSLTRYGYLSLVYFLRWGEWYDPSHRTPHLVQVTSFATPFHNQSWWEFAYQTNRMLYPNEVCDCYRKLPGRLQVNKVSNNRYYYDPEFDNYVTYLDAKGHKGSIHGRVPAKDVSTLLAQQRSASKDFAAAAKQNNPMELLSSPPFDNLTRPFAWSYPSWADTIRYYVSQLDPPPQYIVLNAGLWPNNFLYQPELVSDIKKAIQEVNSNPRAQGFWKTTTHGRGGMVMYKSIPPTDDYMCQELDQCWNVSWTKNLPDRWYLEDGKHFWEPVYRIMNEDLLEQIDALPKGYQKFDRSTLFQY